MDTRAKRCLCPCRVSSSRFLGIGGPLQLRSRNYLFFHNPPCIPQNNLLISQSTPANSKNKLRDAKHTTRQTRVCALACPVRADVVRAFLFSRLPALFFNSESFKSVNSFSKLLWFLITFVSTESECK